MKMIRMEILKCNSSRYLVKISVEGVGYHMNMVKTATCDPDMVVDFIRKHVPDAGLESNAGAELSLVLPNESSDR